MNYNEFLKYVEENLADCYQETMVSEYIDNEIKRRDLADELSDNAIDDIELLRLRQEALKKYDEFEVSLHKVLKNNGVVLDAVSIYQKGEQISPNIYLKPFYDGYLIGKPMDFIMSEIVFQYRNEKQESDFDFVDMKNYEEIKGNIIIRRVNYEMNKKLLKDCPYKKYLDMAVTFRYVVNDSLLGIATILISNKEFECFNVSVDELYQLALFNTMEKFPWSMIPLSKFIYDCFDEHMMEKLSEDVVNELKSIENENIGVNIYILTNSTKAFGSACMMYDNVISNFAKVQDANVYILPSSVHEVMLVPEDENTDPVFLTELLQNANRSSVGLIDLLSDNIYYFDRHKNEMTIFNV